MNISLTPVLESYIKKKVDSGLYHSASEVVREGLRALQKKEQTETLDTLLQERMTQYKSGAAVPLDEATTRIKARIKKKYLAENGV